MPIYDWIFRSSVLKLAWKLLPALKFSNSLTSPELWIKCWNSLTFPWFFGQTLNSLTFPGSPGCVATLKLINLKKFPADEKFFVFLQIRKIFHRFRKISCKCCLHILCMSSNHHKKKKYMNSSSLKTVKPFFKQFTMHEY